jgi:outer membrane immunogenic protein
MNLRIQGMLATTAAAAALLASAHVARADGMPTGPGSYERLSWSGAYVGFESGWNWDHTEFTLDKSHTWDRNGIDAGLLVGYQHQFGPLVAGVEVNIIGNQFDNAGGVAPATSTTGDCNGHAHNCVGRITDVITVGPRLGFAAGRFMPYVTGGWATGSVNFREVGTSGVTVNTGDTRLDGYFLGGGVDWKLARHVVVGIEYRHTDLGSGNMAIYNATSNSPVETIRTRADSDAVLLRGSLLFGREDYAPMK